MAAPISMDTARLRAQIDGMIQSIGSSGNTGLATQLRTALNGAQSSQDLAKVYASAAKALSSLTNVNQASALQNRASLFASRTDEAAAKFIGRVNSGGPAVGDARLVDYNFVEARMAQENPR